MNTPPNKSILAPAFDDAFEPWAGHAEGLPPPHKRKPPSGPPKSTMQMIDAAIERAKGEREAGTASKPPA